MKRSNRKQNNKRTTHVTGVIKSSLTAVFIMMLVFCTFLIGRLVYLNNVNGDRYAKAVLSQQSYSSRTTQSARGAILDRNGIVLARSEKHYNCVLSPRDIQDREYYIEPTVNALVTCMGYKREDIEKILTENGSSRYYVIEKDVDYARVSAFNRHMRSTKYVVGVSFEEEYARVYPFSTLGSHVIGFVGNEGKGQYGLEQYYNDTLTGIDGQTYGYFDSELNSKMTVVEAKDGNTLVTTLDYNIQAIVQKKVSEFIEENGCENVGVIVMDPNSGEILAMASNEEFDLNAPRDMTYKYSNEELEAMNPEETVNALYRMWQNFCITDTYEPGSTFKTITVASALEEDTVMPSDTFVCDGQHVIAGWTIKCTKNHGEINLTQALMKSCNCALMDIVEKLGRDAFAIYQSRFGFGKKTGIDLSGESAGIITDKKNLNAVELATNSFGTTFKVTMVQIAAAYSSLINGGTYYQPHLVKEIDDADGRVVSVCDNAELRKTVSRDTSKFIRNALYMTVQDGTGTAAQVDGYLIGGKTGTAKKRPYEEKKYVCSFAGFAPANDPKALVYVVIDENHNPETFDKSSPASSMCGAIMSEILPYLGCYPEGGMKYFDDSVLINEGTEYSPDGYEDEGNPDVLPDNYGR